MLITDANKTIVDVLNECFKVWLVGLRKMGLVKESQELVALLMAKAIKSS